MTHGSPSIAVLRSLALGEAGAPRTLVVSASGPPFYAGLHRAPAATLWEAVVTLLCRPVDVDLVLVTGTGTHLPRLYPDPGLTVGVIPGVWLARAPRVAPAAAAVPPDEDFFDMASMGNRAAVAAQRVLHACGGLNWMNRLERLLQTVEARCGLRWNGATLIASEPPGSRSVIVVDDAFLLPRWGAEDARPPDARQADVLAARFEDLPARCEAHGVGLVFVASTRVRALALEDGSFLASTAPEGAGALFPRLRLRGARQATLPAIPVERPWGPHLADARPADSLYQTLRTIPPRVRPGPLEELDAMIGLDGLKGEVRRIANTARAQVERQKLGMHVDEFNWNAILVGNPGTGKTSVARILARVYNELGLLTGDRVTEARAPDLIAGYVGQTAARTRTVCERALGGVLFIDEAYALAGDGNSFGPEALAELLIWAEERNRELAILLAGYPDQMGVLLRVNPGLARRFPQRLAFPDYHDDDLVRIAHKLAHDAHSRFAEGCDVLIRGWTRARRAELTARSLPWGNAGEIATLVDEVRQRRDDRVMRNRRGALSAEDLERIRPEDFAL